VADLKGPSIGAVWSEGSSALIYQLVAQAIFTSRPGSGKLSPPPQMSYTLIRYKVALSLKIESKVATIWPQ